MQLPDNKNLPPLDYLVAFECAGRLGGFANAAKHLNISESAISRKVRLLEDHYGVKLFTRQHRSVGLTSQGQELLPSVTEAFDILRERSADLSVNNQVGTVTVAATHSVATLWLTPRLGKFHALHPEILIKLTASDSDAECLGEEVDFPILRGEGDWPGFEPELLFGESVFPVCSPSYLEQHPDCGRLEQIPKQDLIEVSNHHFEWMTWKDWLSHKDLEETTIESNAVFNTYPLVIQAAVDGLGLALGWEHLVDRFLESGQLVRPLGNSAVQTTSGYYLLRRSGQDKNANQKIVGEWLRNEGANERRLSTSD